MAQHRGVLISAYACNPKRGSEEAVGWNWVRTIAQNHKVTVITAAFHKADIASVCDLDANPRFVFVPQRWWHYRFTPFWRAVENSAAKPLMNMVYAHWQRDAWRVAKELVKSEHFDLVHQLTYVGYRFPGHMWKLGLPFVWGPVGGLENTPWRLLPAMGAAGALYYAGRNVINSAQRRWLRTPRRAAVAAGPGLIAGTEGIARELMQAYGVKSRVIREVVAPVELSPPQPRRRQPSEPLRLVWSGLHLPGKALNLLLAALGQIAASEPIELHILGDGPLRKKWETSARSLGLDGRCVWHGKIDRREALAVMANSHALVITSLKDLTSTVLLEGLALGLPVLCPDHCGFSGVVTEACGIKIEPRSISFLIDGFRSGVLRLAHDECTRYSMALSAMERARAYSHDQLRRELDAVYSEVMCPVRIPCSIPIDN